MCGDSMQCVRTLDDLDSLNILYDKRWDQEKPRLLMHSLHAYPAKFPPFLASEAFEYATEEGVNVQIAADIFSGCGTTALESKVRGISFWGCDINPVAVLIARTKVADYNLDSIKYLYYKIIEQFSKERNKKELLYNNASDRMKYWFDEDTYVDLYNLYNSIEMVVEKDYQTELCFFKCIFSSILKQCSRWLQKSIKPQIDPNKNTVSVIKEFENKYKMACVAIKQIAEKHYPTAQYINIQKDNFLKCNSFPNVDLIITSPPYVTSYEYADLHQLSSIWLGYAADYRELRKGTIGSTHIPCGTDIECLKLNNTAKCIINLLSEKKCSRGKRGPIALYYYDMQKAVHKCYSMLNNQGMIICVIGDSELKGVKLENSRHLVEAMITEGFSDIKISKRQVSKGICVPYRDKQGKFTDQKNASNEIYHEEYIISGRKK